MHVLRVSYYYLPSYLKQCFAYCSMLPKGYEFQERQLILLWMAEGLLEQEIDGMTMEELGRKCFRDLLSKSFFQQSRIDDSCFLMHDLIYDLACWAFGGICFNMGSPWDGYSQQSSYRDLRHLSYISDRFVGIKRFEGLYEADHLRTFLALPMKTRKELFVTNNLISHILRLRILSLRGYWIFELPNKIGELKHLRYLDLSYSAIQELPESVSMLYNLQTLILEYSYRLKKLFPDIGNLLNLRHLKNSHSNLLEEMPLRIGKLTSLRTLDKFVVGKGNCSGLRELRPLTHLQERLTISRLENVNDAEDAMEAELNGKAKLNVLALEWSSSTNNDSRKAAEIQIRVLEMLKPHYEGVKELTIQGYGGMKFPAWLGQSSFLNLVFLRLADCNQCTSLPSVGQLPSLKDLVIKGMAKVNIVGVEFSGKYCLEPFPSLETLCFEDMQEWGEWIYDGGQQTKGFPRLRELYIARCPKLKGRLPQRFPSLDRLVINSCEQLFVSYTALPAPCKLEIDGFHEVAWISYPVAVSSSDSTVVSDTSSLEESSAEIQPSVITIRRESLPDGLHELSHITRIDIFGADLVSFPEGGLPPNLRELCIEHCQYLTALPNSMYNLPFLEKLEIRKCPAIVSIPDQVGLPPNVRLLRIEGHNTCRLFLDWGLENLTSLREIFIEDGLQNEASFRLPTSLAKLDIREFPNLKTLSFVQNLTSLERLQLCRCPNLKSFAENGLPPSLLMLDIYLCPLLEERCKKDEGEYWHMVAHIPFVRLDFKLVFDPLGGS